MTHYIEVQVFKKMTKDPTKQRSSQSCLWKGNQEQQQTFQTMPLFARHKTICCLKHLITVPNQVILIHCYWYQALNVSLYTGTKRLEDIY